MDKAISKQYTQYAHMANKRLINYSSKTSMGRFKQVILSEFKLHPIAQASDYQDSVAE